MATAAPLQSVADLLAPTTPATAADVLALYPAVDGDPVRIEKASDSSLIIQLPYPTYTVTGISSRICVAGSWSETDAERLLDRERACLMAVAEEWGVYLHRAATADPTKALAHFAAARAVLSFARSDLGTDGAAWLDHALASLPTSADALKPDPATAGIKAGTQAPAAFLKMAAGPTSIVAILKAVRDTEAAELAFVANYGNVGSPNPEGPMLDERNRVFVDVSAVGACAHNVVPLGTVKNEVVEGVAGPFQGSVGDCLDLAGEWWSLYRETGDDVFRQVAKLAVWYVWAHSGEPHDWVELVQRLE